MVMMMDSTTRLPTHGRGQTGLAHSPVIEAFASELKDQGRVPPPVVADALRRSRGCGGGLIGDVGRAEELARVVVARWLPQCLATGGVPLELVGELSLLGADVCTESVCDTLEELFAAVMEIEILTGDYALLKGLRDAQWVLHAALGVVAHATQARISMHEGEADAALAHAKEAAREAARVTATDTLPLGEAAVRVLSGLGEVRG